MALDARQGESPEWSRLPRDLLEIVSKNITQISDYIRFRSVCKSWRSTAPPANVRPQIPLLLLPYDPLTDARSFFSLSTNRVHTVSLPETHGKVVLASSHGWLLLLDLAAADLSLLDPISRTQIRLPPTSVFYREPGSEFCPELKQFVITSRDGRKRLSVNLDFYIAIYPWVAFLFSDQNSTEEDSWVVTITDYQSRDVYFCRPRDEAWIELKTSIRGHIVSVVYHEGRFYMMDVWGNVSICDAATPSNPAVISSLKAPDFITKHFLVKTDAAELLLFSCWNLSDDDDRFEVFRADLSGQLPEWSKIDSIGGKALFWADRQWWIVCAKGLPECREDCIYFSCPYISSIEPVLKELHHMEVFDVKDGSSQFFSSGWEQLSDRLMRPRWVMLRLC